jgi:hypothetical protein
VVALDVTICVMETYYTQKDLVRVTSYVEPALADWVAERARSNERSIVAEVRILLRLAREATDGR